MFEAEDMAWLIKSDPAALRFTVGYLELKPFFENYGYHSVDLDVRME